MASGHAPSGGRRAAYDDRAAAVDDIVARLPADRAAVSTLLLLAGTGRHTPAHVLAAIDQLERDVHDWPRAEPPETGRWQASRDLIELCAGVCRGADRRRARARLQVIMAAIVLRRSERPGYPMPGRGRRHVRIHEPLIVLAGASSWRASGVRVGTVQLNVATPRAVEK